MSDSRRFVSQLDHIPFRQCWMILRSKAVHHEGDERSRTAPGHGYPEHTERFVEVAEVFEDEESFKEAMAKELKEWGNGAQQVRGFKCWPYSVKRTVELEVNG